MSRGPVVLLVGAFPGEGVADSALQDLRQAERDDQIRIVDAAVLRRDAASKLHIKETADMGGGRGAAIGGTLGAIVGLATGPVGWVALAGAAVGGLLAKMHDAGFPDERLREIGEALPPRSSAIIAVVEDRWADQAERQMQERGAKVLRQQLKEDIAEQLAAGKEVVYGAAVADGRVAVIRAVDDGATAATESASGSEAVGATPTSAAEAQSAKTPEPAA